MSELPFAPPAARITRGSYGDNIPNPVLMMAATLLDSPYQDMSESERLDVRDRMKTDFAFVHLPNREAFQEHFHVKRAHPPQIKVCSKTDRIWLVGYAMPGREELHEQQHIHVRFDPSVGRHVEEPYPVLESTFPDDTLVLYAEVSPTEYRDASQFVDRLPDWVRAGLCKHFGVPHYLMMGVVLATPTYPEEYYYRIAQHAHQFAGPQGIDPAILG